jgi:hypothetical protein
VLRASVGRRADGRARGDGGVEARRSSGERVRDRRRGAGVRSAEARAHAPTHDSFRRRRLFSAYVVTLTTEQTTHKTSPTPRYATPPHTRPHGTRASRHMSRHATRLPTLWRTVHTHTTFPPPTASTQLPFAYRYTTFHSPNQTWHACTRRFLFTATVNHAFALRFRSPYDSCAAARHKRVRDVVPQRWRTTLLESTAALQGARTQMHMVLCPPPPLNLPAANLLSPAIDFAVFAHAVAAGHE